MIWNPTPNRIVRSKSGEIRVVLGVPLPDTVRGHTFGLQPADYLMETRVFAALLNTGIHLVPTPCIYPLVSTFAPILLCVEEFRRGRPS